MSSRRIYITLNTDKEKDRIIENYLSQSYNEKDAIKDALYRLATNCTETEQSGSDNIRNVGVIEKNTTPKGSIKVQMGADSTEKSEKVQSAKSTQSVQGGTKIKKNELEQLKGFM